MISPKITSVACLVLLDAAHCLLATQRPWGKQLGGHWEFPGGKVEASETPETALRREIDEELGFVPENLQDLDPVEHDYPFGSIRLIPLLSRCEIRPTVHLHEHAAFRWVPMDSLHQLNWAPADIPIIAQLQTHL